MFYSGSGKRSAGNNAVECRAQNTAPSGPSAEDGGADAHMSRAEGDRRLVVG